MWVTSQLEDVLPVINVLKTEMRNVCFPGIEVNDWIQKIKGADGIILGSPVHYSALSATMKSFLDRAFYVAGNNGGMLRHKVGTSVVAVRRSGGIPTFNQLNNYISYSEMLMPTSKLLECYSRYKPRRSFTR